jgi:hypothetical protein
MDENKRLGKIQEAYQGRYARALTGMFSRNVNGTELKLALHDIDERLKELEEKTFKTVKRLKATKAQRTLILKHLGLLDLIEQLDISKNNKALLLSVIIDADPDVEKDMNNIAKKSPDILSKYNYEFLVKLFDQVGLEKQAGECEKLLTKIKTQEEKNSDSK